MVWRIAAGVCLAGLVAAVVVLWKRSTPDHGAVSEQWLAEHRVDLP
jgi:hypothetical protein